MTTHDPESTGVRIIALVSSPNRPAQMGATPVVAHDPIERVDIYDFAHLNLDGVTGILITGMCDQEFLSRQQPKLEAFVRAGGRVLINGHVTKPFLPGLPKWRKLMFSRPEDLVIEPANPHPIWQGIDLADVLYRTGVPGAHTRAELEQIGVAGFYGRGYAVRLPADATVINTIGPLRAPIDYAFPLGDGEVAVHQGLDLEAFPDAPGTTLGSFAPNVRAWLGSTR
ncbi:hypothetical protein JOF28_000788 [Leucobacter exalbidus]|uniref:Uncharacterized protein n=1 Tax=Leucobacter exalbidus TaxID=662960 RepID=A0A940PWN1_9MICO|nr:hypothetical protein [Leucobacter exalbidus]MBP1325556.1 hypothetical protein [Leucobacter exalbidus]